jgi:hypothetical protein
MLAEHRMEAVKMKTARRFRPGRGVVKCQGEYCGQRFT